MHRPPHFQNHIISCTGPCGGAHLTRAQLARAHHLSSHRCPPVLLITCLVIGVHPFCFPNFFPTNQGRPFVGMQFSRRPLPSRTPGSYSSQSPCCVAQHVAAPFPPNRPAPRPSPACVCAATSAPHLRVCVATPARVYVPSFGQGGRRLFCHCQYIY